MDTDVWRTLTAAVRSADRRVPRGGRKMRFSDQQIVRMFLWCVWHDRPLCWACDPSHYTSRFRPWQLPSIAQFCRRVKSTRVNELLTAVNEYLVRRGEPTRIAVLDGKPLAIGDYSRDPDARDGRGAGRFQRGYKLHALTTLDGRILRHCVRSLNVGEPNTARQALIGSVPPGTLVLADTNYDSAALYTAVATHHCQLLTPLKGRSQQPERRKRMGAARRTILELWESRADVCRALLRLRPNVERLFSALSGFGGGLVPLPPWVRRHDRVARWVAAKVAIYHARLHCRKAAS
jgi:hypothetical protein